jgi:hypothetical protein
MRAQRVRVFNYHAENRQYLFMKSLYIPDDLDNFEEQSKFDQSLHKLDLFDFSNYGPNADYFDEVLREHGWRIEEFDLKKTV